MRGKLNVIDLETKLTRERMDGGALPSSRFAVQEVTSSVGHTSPDVPLFVLEELASIEDEFLFDALREDKGVQSPAVLGHAFRP